MCDQFRQLQIVQIHLDPDSAFTLGNEVSVDGDASPCKAHINRAVGNRRKLSGKAHADQ